MFEHHSRYPIEDLQYLNLEYQNADVSKQLDVTHALIPYRLW
jgi:hypothetical protein